MKLLSLFVLTFLILSTVQSDDREARVDALFKQYSTGPGVFVSVIQNGKFVYKKGFGYSDARNKVPITEDTKFLIGSVSKQFTAMAIAILEYQGLVNVNEPIQKYIPELKVLGRTTLLQLLQHVSGYRDYLNLGILTGRGLPAFDFTRQEAFELIERQESIAFPPNSKWDYSNTGYLLAEIVIERVTKMDFQSYLKKAIFEPLGMNHTHVENDRGVIIENAAYGYVPDALNPKIPKYQALISTSIAGAGGIQTTANDFFKFDQNFYNNKLPGGQRLISKITTPGRLNDGTNHKYGYGLMIDEQAGLKFIHHSGAFPGYFTNMIRCVDKNLTVFMTSNIYDTNVLVKSNEALKIYLGLDVKLNHIVEQPEIEIQPHFKQSIPKRIQKFLGYYYSRELRITYHIQQDQNGFFFHLGRMGRIPIILINNHEFWIGAPGNLRGRFIESNGQITQLEIINFSRAPNIYFRKMESEPHC